MESLSVAQVAVAHGLPFIAVRVIVDGAGDDLPVPVREAADASRQLRVWRLLGQMLLAPAAVMPMIRLTRRYIAASRSLAAVARAGHLAPEALVLGPDAGGSQGADLS
jgi:adenosylhomocysteine nucleosidase